MIRQTRSKIISNKYQLPQNNPTKRVDVLTLSYSSKFRDNIKKNNLPRFGTVRLPSDHVNQKMIGHAQTRK